MLDECLCEAPTAPRLSAVRAVLNQAAAHYRGALRASPTAVHYLAQRGISGAAAARFGLGYANPKWQDLHAVFADHDQRAVDASGLVATSGEGDRARRYDRFRDRLMFPIRASDGQVAGFGGRVLVDGDAPKYLNSPEGIGFSKRELLYGLYEAQAAIRAESLAVVVEGYLDVVSLSQAGFWTSVATLGTACSRSQVAQLLEITSRLVFCFDGDAAGHRAAEAVLANVLPLSAGRRIEFMFLPPEHDPDSFVRTNGIGAFRSALSEALPLAAYLLQCASSSCDLQYAEGRARCAHKLRAYHAQMPDSDARSELVAQCAVILGCSGDQVLGLWRKPGRCI
jgi:DNA primase